MPTLGMRVGDQIGVEGPRLGTRLAVNRETGAWAVLNASAVHALGQLARGGLPDPPSRVRDRLRELLSPQGCAGTDGGRAQGSLYIIYKLTDACNFSCTYCYDRRFCRRRSPERRDRAFRTVLETFLADPGHRAYVLFHGGEPLLELATLRRVVEEQESRFPGRIFFSIQTNGSLLSDEIVDFLARHRVGLSVSVDGVTLRDNALRINRTTPNPYENILRLTDTNRLLRRASLGLHLTVTPHNYRRVDRILLQMEQDGFRSVSFSFYQSVDRMVEARRDWDADVLVAKMLELVELVNQRRIAQCAIQYLIQLTLRVLHLGHELVCLSAPCGAGRNIIVVYPSGELGPCDSIFDPRLLSNSPADYEGARIDSPVLGRLLRRSVDGMEACRDCDLKRFCNGTCPGSAMLATSDVEGVDPFECRFNFGLIRALLRAVADPACKTWLEYCVRHVGTRAKVTRALFESAEPPKENVQRAVTP